MDKALDSSSIIDLQAPTALSSEFIGRLEHSPRGDHRVIAPILTIEQENAQPPPPVAPGSQSGGDPGTSTRGPRARPVKMSSRTHPSRRPPSRQAILATTGPPASKARHPPPFPPPMRPPPSAWGSG